MFSIIFISQPILVSKTLAQNPEGVHTGGVILKKLNGPEDWPFVELALNEFETEGLQKIDFVSTKATGTTGLSSVTNVVNRAIKKIKMAASMMGGNLVYIKESAIEGNLFLFRSSRTQVLGTVYTSFKMDQNAFSKQIKVEEPYTLISKITFPNNANRPHYRHFKETKKAQLSSYEFQGDKIWVTANIPGISDRIFRVTYFNENRLILYYKRRNKHLNLILIK
ncbi:MAG: hypothetical protein L6Q51_08560 [Cyclobacteriaceae bacterium]|nr:hypothetical protein [Cyclobacteriaceae bacterium]